MEKTFDIYHDLIINATKQAVFDAVSQPEHLNNWWTLRCSGVPVIGEEYNLYFAPEYNWFGSVSVCDPNQAFHIKMTHSNADWDPTTFGFDLEEEVSGVRLKFFHKNWQNCNTEFRTSSFCWAILLQGLKNYLENGTVIPFDKRA